MRKWSLSKSKKAIAVGLTTAVVATSIVVPVAASGDFSSVSITAMVEEYISESDAEDPVAELIGEEEASEIVVEKKASVPALTAVSEVEAPAEAEGQVEAANAENEGTKADEAAAEVAEAEEEKQPEAVPAQPEVSEPKAEEPATEAAEAEPEKVVVKYPQFEDRCLATAGVLNIRAEASPDADVIGQIEKGGIALVEEKGTKWTKIGSGICEGYASNDFLVFGDEAGAWAERNNIPKYVKVTGNGLRVRAEANKDGEVLTTLYENETCDVLSEGKEWVKIETSDGKIGYVSADYVEIRFETTKAKTMDQIEAVRKAQEEEARREQEKKDAEAKAAAEKAAAEKASKKNNSSNAKKAETKTETKKETKTETKKETKQTSETTSETKTEQTVVTGTNSALRAQMVEYAKQFLGNPYVYGGTSLTNGTDCSGFTMRIYEHFGYKIPRAGGQRTFGKKIKVSEAQPGDLIFYPGHVTMYIGGGQVIHASSAKVGIIISSLSYSGTPEFATNIIDYVK